MAARHKPLVGARVRLPGQDYGGSALAVAGLTARSLVTTRGPRVCTTRVCVRRDRPGGGTKGKPKGLPTVPRTN